MAADFSVYAYDRRGRGDSSDTLPFAIDREVEDLAALITVAGGSAYVFGFSSGGLLALHAAARGVPITRLALLEPPMRSEDEGPSDLAQQIARLVSSGHRREAVQKFLTSIGVPSDILSGMEPSMPALDAVAHTLVYDCLIADATSREMLGSVATPTVVLHSHASSQDLIHGAVAIARALPNATIHGLVGDWHGVEDADLASALTVMLHDND